MQQFEEHLQTATPATVLEGRITTAYTMGKSLETELRGIINLFDESTKQMDLTEHLVFFYRFKTLIETLNDGLKDSNKFKTFLQYTAIPKLMNEQDVKTVTVDSISSRFVKSTKLNVKGNSASDLSAEELSAKIFEWLREVGAGSLIKETVNAQSLSAFAKSRIEQEGKDLPEELFEVSTTESVSVTTVKPSKSK